MEQSLIRLLKSDEIECRISIINEKGLSLLLYKDARVDQKILDETFGPFGWKRSHQSIEGSLYCTVEILDKDSGEWVSKQDVGTTGYAEKEKSQASDSFKRACFNWGIGRELYSAPFIWIPASKAGIQKKDNKCYCNESFRVMSIAYSDSREITGLVIAGGKCGTVFEWKLQGRETDKPEAVGKDKPEAVGKEPVKKPSISKEQMEGLETELQRTGVAIEDVQKRYKVNDPLQMTEETYNRVMRALSRTKSADAA